MVETLKQETRKKKELEKRFRKKGEFGADGALERLGDGGTSSDDSDSDDEMKLKETQEAGASMAWYEMHVGAIPAMLRVLVSRNARRPHRACSQWGHPLAIGGAAASCETVTCAMGHSEVQNSTRSRAL